MRINLHDDATWRIVQHFNDEITTPWVDNFNETRDRFETFAGLDAPALPPSEHDALQVRLHRWQVHQFGPPTAAQLALGIAEEFGERVDAQERLNEAEVEDATGDILVYMAQNATLHRLSMGRIYGLGMTTWFGRTASSARSIASHVGYLAHVTLKASQRIRGFDDPERVRFGVFMAQAAICSALMQSGRDPWEILEEVAEKVMKRDWRSNPVQAAEIAAAAP